MNIEYIMKIYYISVFLIITLYYFGVYWLVKDYLNPKGKNPGDVLQTKYVNQPSKQPNHPGWLDQFEDDRHHSLNFNNPLGKNPGDFFQITTQPFPEAHFAVYPVALCEKPIKSSVPNEVCVECGTPRERIIERTVPEMGVDLPVSNNPKIAIANKLSPNSVLRIKGGDNYAKWKEENPDKFLGWTSCSCNKGFKGATVLDPFTGAGTTWVALKKYKPKAKFIGIELKKEYIDMAYLRVGKRLDTGPFLKFT